MSNISKRKSVHVRDDLDEYIKAHSLRLHPAQQKLIEITKSLEWGRMISNAQAMQLQQNLVKAIGGKKAIEIGTFTGYGALSIALVLPPDGKVVACDISNDAVNMGRRIFKEAKVDHKIDVRIAPATETLQKLLDAGEADTYDYAFIDADKSNYDTYYEMSLQLVRSGGIIALDNTLWGCQVLQDDSEIDEATKIIKALNKKIASDPRVRVSLLRIGDGVTICFKE